MRSLLFSMALTVLLVGCESTSPSTATAEPSAVGQDSAKDTEEIEITTISVEDAATAMQSGAVAVDANSKRTRERYGTLPEAVILTSTSKYELSELPGDKSKDLIFYCSNTFCTASDTAAERASANGYEKVHVMRKGIKGWKEAGKPTQNYPRS